MERTWDGASIVVALVTTLLMSCTHAPKPPDFRFIDEARLELVREHIELPRARSHAHWIINEAAREMLDPAIGTRLRQDLAVRTEAIKNLMRSDKIEEIKSATDELDSLLRLLGDVRGGITSLEKKLDHMSKDLSPALLAPVEQLIQASRASLESGSWEDIRRSADSLERMNSYVLAEAKNCWDYRVYLEKLGGKVGPILRQQIESALQPLPRALNGESWDDVLTLCRQLPAFVSAPRRVVNDIEVGRRYMDFLQPAERGELQEDFAAVDRALQGSSWEDAANASRIALSTAVQRFGGGAPIRPAPCVRILSIDGGGVRGLIPAMVLQELQRLTDQPIHKLFDYVVGTSAGGIIALGLSVPDDEDPSQARYRPSDLVRLFEEEANRIFPVEPFKDLRGLAGPKYSPKGLEQLLNEYFDDALLVDALTNVLITTYVLEDRHGMFMTNYNDGAMLYMREVARATSAAPTYFPPVQVAIPPRPLKLERPSPANITIDHVSLLDGGVYANNPAGHGLTKIRLDEAFYETGRTGQDKPWLLLSLGTGKLPSSVPSSDPRGWGLAKWAKPLVDILFSNTSLDVNNVMRPSEYYFRLQPETLTDNTESLDTSDSQQIAELVEIARKFIQKEKEKGKLTKIAALLKRQRPAECLRESIRIDDGRF